MEIAAIFSFILGLLRVCKPRAHPRRSSRRRHERKKTTPIKRPDRPRRPPPKEENKTSEKKYKRKPPPSKELCTLTLYAMDSTQLEERFEAILNKQEHLINLLERILEQQQLYLDKTPNNTPQKFMRNNPFFAQKPEEGEILED